MKKIWKNNLYKEIFLIILSFILGALFVFVLYNRTNNYHIIKNDTHVYEKTSLKPAIDKIYDAVVFIEGYIGGDLSNRGTGFVYKTDDSNGYIVTNEHVIEDCTEIKVMFSNDQEVSAEVLGKDSYLDLAILKVPKKYVLQVASLSTSEKTNLGDTVFTVGSPIGKNYRGSVTSGILSGKDRLVSTSVSDSNQDDWVMKVLQVDASINPGNSGGPLLNVNGEVIGICSLKLVDDDVEGMGFAIPIEYAKGYMDDLEKGKTLKRPVLGISMSNIDDTSKLMRNNIDVNNKLKEGVVVLKTKENIPLKKGDIIIKINNNDTKDIAYLKYELYKHNPGDTIKVTYYRNNHKKISKIKLKGEK